MAKRARSQKKDESVSLAIEIEDHLIHYAFGERWPNDRIGPALSESLSVTIWGTITSPVGKAGRDLQATISESEHLAHPLPIASAGEASPPIGELQWGAGRVARIYVPPPAIWRLAHALAAGHLKRLSIKVDAPLRGNVPIRSMHLLTRELMLRIGRTVIGAAREEEKSGA